MKAILNSQGYHAPIGTICRTSLHMSLCTVTQHQKQHSLSEKQVIFSPTWRCNQQYKALKESQSAVRYVLLGDHIL